MEDDREKGFSEDEGEESINRQREPRAKEKAEQPCILGRPVNVK